jgi:hypothetical protein
MKSKLLTRIEIINLWLDQAPLLSKYCCPNCRDLLYLRGKYYYCENDLCGYYNQPIERVE